MHDFEDCAACAFGADEGPVDVGVAAGVDIEGVGTHFGVPGGGLRRVRN